MGCDIHLYAERRNAAGQWESADKWGPDKYDESDGRQVVDYDNRFYRGRNYDLFAILADVRNGRGFAGVSTGDGFQPIDAARGLPPDCDQRISADAQRWGSDGHSHSWLTVAELLAFDWTQFSKHRGVVDAAEFVRWCGYRRERGLGPESYCGGVSGRSVQNISVEEMEQRIAAIKQPFIDRNSYGWIEEFEAAVIKELADHSREHFYCSVEWNETYYRSAANFWSECIPKLLRLGKPDDVRIVFWFDN